MNLKSVGVQIKHERENKHLTQEQLAEKVGLSRNYISYIERGTKTPKLETLIKIANALEVSANTLLKDLLDCDDNLFDSQISIEINNLSKRDKDIVEGLINVLKNTNSKY